MVGATFEVWKVYTNWNLTYTTRQGIRVSCLAQNGFAAFGKGVQLISGSPYAETEQLSRLTSPTGMESLLGWRIRSVVSPTSYIGERRFPSSENWMIFLCTVQHTFTLLVVIRTLAEGVNALLIYYLYIKQLGTIINICTRLSFFATLNNSTQTAHKFTEFANQTFRCFCWHFRDGNSTTLAINKTLRSQSLWVNEKGTEPFTFTKFTNDGHPTWRQATKIKARLNESHACSKRRPL